MGIDSHLSTCVGTQSPKYLEMAQRHISLSVLQIQGEGGTPHHPTAMERHLARAHFAQRLAMRQGPYPVRYEFFNQVAPTAQAGGAPKGPFIHILLRHFKGRVR
jgi:hypothetical protein